MRFESKISVNENCEEFYQEIQSVNSNADIRQRF